MATRKATAFTSANAASVAVAFAVLIVSGVTYRSLAGHYGRRTEGIRIERGTLSKLPTKVSEWLGYDIPLGGAVIQATDTDDHVNRKYVQARGGRQVSLWLAYGIRLRDLQPHRPEICYPGAGWTLDDIKEVSLQLEAGGKLPCRILSFHRGGLYSGVVVVLNYYIVDGTYCPDVSLLRSKQWRLGESGARYAAEVQIASSQAHDVHENEQAVRVFAALIARPIEELITSEVAAAAQGVAGS
jgi:EpsI family protein